MCQEYKELRSYLERKTNLLWKHETSVQRLKYEEEKNYYQGSFGIDNCFPYDTPDGIHFGIAYAESFKTSLELYESAFEKHPEMFGTGDAMNVIDALYNTMEESRWNLFDWNTDRYIEYLQTESCLYAVPKVNGAFLDDSLRVDLFRMIGNDKTVPSRKEFIGGLFHIFDHFSINRKNLATGQDVNDVNSLWDVVKLCVDSFPNKQYINDKESVSFAQYDERHQLKVSFYREEESGVFYIKTAHLE